MPPPDPEALDTVLRQFAGYRIKRAFHLMQTDLNATLRPLGLRMSSFSVLSVIASQDGVRQSQLADALSIERPNVVQLIDELETAGWIARCRDPADRRAWILTCTPEGRTHWAAAADAVRAHDLRMTDGLTAPERAALIAILTRIEGNGQPSGPGRS